MGIVGKNNYLFISSMIFRDFRAAELCCLLVLPPNVLGLLLLLYDSVGIHHSFSFTLFLSHDCISGRYLF